MTGRGVPRDETPFSWSRVWESVRARVGEHNFERWLAPARATWSPDGLRLTVSDAASRDRILRHFVTPIAEALRAAGSAATVSVDVAALPGPLPVRAVPTASGHTFATFVVGQSNEAAHHAARALVDRHRSPLFLHGPSGVGKTHLLHAVGHALTERNVAVACLPAADLVAALIAACETHGEAAFWHDLGVVGALLLDDVHSLAGQEEMQERLMHGLASWMADGRLLALTSDRRPDEVPRLTAAVRDHVAGGVVAPIERPEPALRVAILQRKAGVWGLTLDAALAGRIAGAVGGNVRRLEGALMRLLAHARLYGRRIDETLASEVLPELRALAAPPISITGIVEATAAVFGVRARMLVGRSRRTEIVLPRQVAMYLARQLLHRPFAEIAAQFARDHTAALAAWRRVTARLGVDAALTRLVVEVEQRLSARGGGDDGRASARSGGGGQRPARRRPRE